MKLILTIDPSTARRKVVYAMKLDDMHKVDCQASLSVDFPTEVDDRTAEKLLEQNSHIVAVYKNNEETPEEIPEEPTDNEIAVKEEVSQKVTEDHLHVVKQIAIDGNLESKTRTELKKIIEDLGLISPPVVSKKELFLDIINKRIDEVAKEYAK